MSTFDIHKYVKDFQSSGFNEQQAEMIVKSIFENKDFEVSKLATSEQLLRTEEKLRSEMSLIAERMDNKINSVEKELKSEINSAEERMSTKVAEVKIMIAESTSNILKWIIPLFATTILSVISAAISIFIKFN